MDVTWKAGNAALVASFPEGIKISTNDLAAESYRKIISLAIPRLSTRLLVTSQVEGSVWLEAAELVADAYVDIYSAPKDYTALNAAQIAYVAEQDAPTGRVTKMVEGLRKEQANLTGMPFKLDTSFPTSLSPMVDHVHHQNGMFLPQPTLPGVGHKGHRPTPKPAKRRTEHDHRFVRRLTPLPDFSDSDGEDGMSEIDRDAIVARSRYSKGRPIFKEEEQMSSGDESDNADLTDGDSINSDWSDLLGLFLFYLLFR